MAVEGENVCVPMECGLHDSITCGELECYQRYMYGI